MKIAIPSRDGAVDSHFGHCEAFTIYTVTVEDGTIIAEEQLTPPPGCGCKSNIIPTLSQMGVSVLLGGNMGQGAANMLLNNGIQVVRGCQGIAREVAQSWLDGSLTDQGGGCDHHDCSHH